MKILHKRKGFTLIEILIVVTILLSLSVLGAMKYMSIVEQNNINLDRINARTIAEGIKLAGLSGAIDLNKDVSGASIEDPELAKFIDTSIVPKSKHFGGNSARFTYSISKQNVTVHANGLVVYPDTSKQKTLGD